MHLHISGLKHRPEHHNKRYLQSKNFEPYPTVSVVNALRWIAVEKQKHTQEKSRQYKKTALQINPRSFPAVYGSNKKEACHAHNHKPMTPRKRKTLLFATQTRHRSLKIFSPWL
jgi:hypothetical protein